MLGTFPKEFPQSRLAKHQFFQLQLPKCAISQEATSQRLGSQRRRRLQWETSTADWGPSAAAETGWGRALRLEQTWEVAVWKLAHLGKYPTLLKYTIDARIH